MRSHLAVRFVIRSSYQNTSGKTLLSTCQVEAFALRLKLFEYSICNYMKRRSYTVVKITTNPSHKNASKAQQIHRRSDIAKEICLSKRKKKKKYVVS